MARPRKPLAKHHLDGTYRKDRHGDGVDFAQGTGRPQKPPGLSKAASAFWDRVVEPLADLGVATGIDALALESMARWFAQYQKLMGLLEAAPPVVSFKLQIQCGQAWNIFAAIASKYGLTPADRARLGIDFTPKPKGVSVRDRKSKHSIEEFLE